MQLAAVDAACCDDGETCANGIPVQCDSECAATFSSFYTQCHEFLAAQSSPDQMASYDRFHST